MDTDVVTCLSITQTEKVKVNK